MGDGCLKMGSGELLSLACDFRDIEDSIIWTIQKLGEYDADRAKFLAEELLKEIINYKSKNIEKTHLG